MTFRSASKMEPIGKTSRQKESKRLKRQDYQPYSDDFSDLKDGYKRKEKYQHWKHQLIDDELDD